MLRKTYSPHLFCIFSCFITVIKHRRVNLGVCPLTAENQDYKGALELPVGIFYNASAVSPFSEVVMSKSMIKNKP